MKTKSLRITSDNSKKPAFFKKNFLKNLLSQKPNFLKIHNFPPVGPPAICFNPFSKKFPKINNFPSLPTISPAPTLWKLQLSNMWNPPSNAQTSSIPVPEVMIPTPSSHHNSIRQITSGNIITNFSKYDALPHHYKKEEREPSSKNSKTNNNRGDSNKVFGQPVGTPGDWQKPNPARASYVAAIARVVEF